MAENDRSGLVPGRRTDGERVASCRSGVDGPSREVFSVPWIHFFADGRDVNILLDRLNADPEVAFIVPDGPLDPVEAYCNRLRASMGGRAEAAFYGHFDGIVDDGYRQRWKAVNVVEELKDGSHTLWHVPAGPLPLLTDEGRSGGIPDPWAGWTEQRPGAELAIPDFEGHSAEIRLDLWTRHRPYSDDEKASLPLLHAYWDREEDLLVAGGLYWSGGRHPPPPTRRWWNRLKTWFRRSAALITDGEVSLWAFPSALRKLKAGMAYNVSNRSLSKSIRSAELPSRCPRAWDLFPTRPVTIEPAWLRWNEGTVVRLAQAAYDSRSVLSGTLDNARLAVLADALQEAGCQEASVLAHLREQGSHWRGCWLLDLLLNKG
jgi:hypothetical protein